jgi:branched-chain amino acid transport system permease protein
MVDWLIHVVQLGSIYSALAVGFCLYFGTMRLINLAHGDVFTLGVFAALGANAIFGPLYGVVGFVILLTSSILTGLFIGPVIEVVAFRPIRSRKSYVLLLTSVAVSIVLREGLALLYPNGANPHPFPDPFSQFILQFGTVTMRLSWLISTIFLLLSACILYMLTRRTSLGRRIRAVAQDPTAAAMLGINVDRVTTFAFAIASAMACVAGCFYGMMYGVAKYDMGLLLGLRGFAAAALGGMGRIKGGILGGFLLAAFELASSRFLPGGSGYRDVVVFAILILVLAARPRGLLGGYSRDIHTSITRRVGTEVAT